MPMAKHIQAKKASLLITFPKPHNQWWTVNTYAEARCNGVHTKRKKQRGTFMEHGKDVTGSNLNSYRLKEDTGTRQVGMTGRVQYPSYGSGVEGFERIGAMCLHMESTVAVIGFCSTHCLSTVLYCLCRLHCLYCPCCLLLLCCSG